MNKPKITTKLRLVALCLAAALVLTAMCATSVFAADLPKVTAESKTVHRGQRFEVDVTIGGNTGLTALKLHVGYDSGELAFVGYRRGSALSTMTLTVNTNGSTLVFAWDAVLPDVSDGVVLTLVFDNDIDGNATTSQIRLAYDPDNTRADYKVPQELTTESGTVAITDDDYYVVYRNYDGTELQRTHCTQGSALPDYNGQTPLRAEDSKYVYSFGGWQAAVSKRDDEVVYQAVFNTVAKQYQVNYFIADEQGESTQKIDTYTKIYDYNAEIVLPQPSKDGFVFVGWYTDEACKNKFVAGVMPDGDLNLYGYWRFSVREQGPTLKLSYAGEDGNTLLVRLDVSDNNGVCNMKMNLVYDNTALSFVGYERGDALGDMTLSTSGTTATYPYTFMWSADDNSYQNGTALVMKFSVREGVANGGYRVALSYDRTSDVTYYDNSRAMWYTAVNINEITLPVGTVNSWIVTTEDQQTIETTSDKAEKANVELVVKTVTADVDVMDDLQTVIGADSVVKQAYEIRLVADGVTVAPKGNLTIKIKLSSSLQMSSKLRLYHYGDDGVATLVSSKIEDGYLIFETDHLSTWLIVGEDTSVHSDSCIAWVLIAVAFVLAVMCIVACSSGGAKGSKVLAVIVAVVAVGAVAAVCAVHICLYTMLCGVLCVLLAVATVCVAFLKRQSAVADLYNGAATAYKVRGNKNDSGCYLISDAGGDFRFDICDGDNRVLATSALTFDTVNAAKQGIAICRNGGALATVCEGEPKDNYPCFVVYKAKDGWHFRLDTERNFTLVRSRAFGSKKACEKALEYTRANMRSLEAFVK